MIDLNEIYSILIKYVPREISQIIIKYTYVNDNTKIRKFEIVTQIINHNSYSIIMQDILEYINIKQNINIWDKKKYFINIKNNFNIYPYGIIANSETRGYILIFLLSLVICKYPINFNIHCNILNKNCKLQDLIDNIIQTDILKSVIILNKKEYDSKFYNVKILNFEDVELIVNVINSNFLKLNYSTHKAFLFN